VEPNKEIRLKGTPVSEGIALGNPFSITSEDEVIPDFSIGVGEIYQDISLYRNALFSIREEVKKLQSALETQGSFEAVTIIDTHLQMLCDPLMTTHMEERIRQMRRNTEVPSAIQGLEKIFQSQRLFFQAEICRCKRPFQAHFESSKPASIANDGCAGTCDHFCK
jgi:phosphoenolpyruvate-protein kinase (PTS system EI component)